MDVYDNEIDLYIRRVLDSYDSVSELLDAIGFDLWDLVEWLLEEGYINETTMPHIFEEETSEELEYDE